MEWNLQTWDQEAYRRLQAHLKGLADPAYREFNRKIVPDTEMLGVRMPALRGLAKEIAKGDWKGYLRQAGRGVHEEILLQGLVLGAAKAEPEEIADLLEAFLPKINNWAVCDSTCTGLKIADKHPGFFYSFLLPYLDSEKEYEARFAVVLLLSHYVNGDYIQKVLSILNHVRYEGYYVKMAVAWAVSVCYVKFPTETSALLLDNALDDFTYQKSLQKITESYRVTPEQKEFIRSLKR